MASLPITGVTSLIATYDILLLPINNNQFNVVLSDKNYQELRYATGVESFV
jgi:hypothetical protein